MDIEPGSPLKGKLINQVDGLNRLKGSLVRNTTEIHVLPEEAVDEHPRLRGSLAKTAIGGPEIYNNRDSGPWELFDRTTNSHGDTLLRLRSLVDGATVNIRESRLEDEDTPWKKAE